MTDDPEHRPAACGKTWKEKLYVIIFEADTPAGRAFDVGLLIVICVSVLAVTLESVDAIHAKHGALLHLAEWFFTVLFTLEYILRVIITKNPRAYIFSFFGMIDLLACLPTYLELFLGGAGYLLVIRVLRMLRVFRILKMVRHLKEGTAIMNALRSARPKITVFLFGIVALTVIMGTLMYLIEGDEEGGQFTNIPQSVYWCIVTLTTVGYGDITPITMLGQFLAAIIMIMGYSIIAVPTGVITVELIREVQSEQTASARTCRNCMAEGHRMGARFCYHCGLAFQRPEEELHPPPP